MSLLDTASLIVTPNGYKEGTLYSVIPSDGSGDMNVVRATTATRVNSDGLIESVASNIPRLDYSNGTCPSLLVEPQRTNLLLRSQELSNASWVATNVTVTPNYAVSPDGNTNAEKIILDAGTTSKRLFQTAIQSGTYTFSVYLKAGTHNFVQLLVGNDPSPFSNFNISNGTVSGSYGKIESVGNGWYRCSITYTSIIGTSIFIWAVDSLSSSRADSSSSTGDFYAWGTQLEAGSYATSYIPTVASAVTRNADLVSKTGISSLIGQTEGTVYWEGQVNGFDQYPQLFDLNANGNKFIQIFNSVISGIPRIGIYVQNVGVLLIESNIATISYNTNFKFALGYKANDYVVYLNGNQVYTNTTIGVPSTSNFGLGDAEQGGSTSKKNVNASALWKTRLTNTQLAQLTTI